MLYGVMYCCNEHSPARPLALSLLKKLEQHKTWESNHLIKFKTREDIVDTQMMHKGRPIKHIPSFPTPMVWPCSIIDDNHTSETPSFVTGGSGE